MTGLTFAALHAKCMNKGACTGPGCKITRSRKNTAEPRKRTTPTKAERHLAKRVEAYEQHGQNPRGGLNPSNSSGQGHDMHRPGSKKK